MADIALFHSVLGMRVGMADATQRLRAAGHMVLPVDQYDGRMFDDYATANEFAAGLGFPELMSRALAAVHALPDGFVCIGFSNGGGMAEHVALHRAVSGVVLCSGALPVQMLGADAWPNGVPAQIHYMDRDPLRQQGWTEAVAQAVTAAGAAVEVFEYPGAGHLFTDPSLPAEYDPGATEQLWRRVLAFCG